MAPHFREIEVIEIGLLKGSLKRTRLRWFYDHLPMP